MTFPFPWINGEDFTSIGVSTNGLILVPIANWSLSAALPIKVGGGRQQKIPRISVVQSHIGDTRVNNKNTFIKEASDGKSVTISWENLAFYQGQIDSTGNGLVNAQATLHDTGVITLCYGEGIVAEDSCTGKSSIAGGIEDDEVELAYPIPTNIISEFDREGIATTYPKYDSCACYYPGEAWMQLSDTVLAPPDCATLDKQACKEGVGSQTCKWNNRGCVDL